MLFRGRVKEIFQDRSLNWFCGRIDLTSRRRLWLPIVKIYLLIFQWQERYRAFVVVLNLCLFLLNFLFIIWISISLSRPNSSVLTICLFFASSLVGLIQLGVIISILALFFINWFHVIFSALLQVFELFLNHFEAVFTIFQHLGAALTETLGFISRAKVICTVCWDFGLFIVYLFIIIWIVIGNARLIIIVIDKTFASIWIVAIPNHSSKPLVDLFFDIYFSCIRFVHASCYSDGNRKDDKCQEQIWPSVVRIVK